MRQKRSGSLCPPMLQMMALMVQSLGAQGYPSPSPFPMGYQPVPVFPMGSKPGPVFPTDYQPGSGFHYEQPVRIGLPIDNQPGSGFPMGNQQVFSLHDSSDESGNWTYNSCFYQSSLLCSWCYYNIKYRKSSRSAWESSQLMGVKVSALLQNYICWARFAPVALIDLLITTSSSLFSSKPIFAHFTHVVQNAATGHYNWHKINMDIASFQSDCYLPSSRPTAYSRTIHALPSQQ